MWRCAVMDKEFIIFNIVEGLFLNLVFEINKVS